MTIQHRTERASSRPMPAGIYALDLARLALFASTSASQVAVIRMVAANGPEARAGAAGGKPSQIAVIPLHGVLTSRSSDSWYSSSRGMDSVRAELAQAAADPSVSTIVLSIDSPGGSVSGTPETAQAVRDAAAQKGVIAIADTLAASAAYWIGSQASRFVVAPSADVGSIGVVAMHQDVSEMYRSFGVNVSVVSAGKYKTELYPFGPLSDEGRAALQSSVDDSYAGFIKAVAEGRKTTQAIVRGGFGEGRTVSASSAVALGMADAVMTMEDLLGSLGAGRTVRAVKRRSALAFA
ncbi:signal peptide peptidase SppA [Rhizobiales bacterium GAS188]|nr:signal peptide peptidase SppA [Rhizobiales bacterium GAS188]